MLSRFDIEHLQFFYTDRDKVELRKLFQAHMDNPNMKLYSAIYRGTVIAILGVREVDRGVGTVWFTPCKDVWRYRIGLVKACKWGIAHCLDLGFKRLQAVVRKDFDKGRNFLSYLGFKEEGLLEGYGTDGTAHYIFGRSEWQHLCCS